VRSEGLCVFNVKILLERLLSKFGTCFDAPKGLLRSRISLSCSSGLLLALILSSVNVEAAFKRVYVNQGASSSGDGSTWGKAYTELRDALTSIDASRQGRASAGNDVSIDRGEILIAEGNYRPSAISSEAGRYRSFDISDWYSFSLVGGFSGGESQLDQADPSSHVTILSGDLNQDGLPDGNSYNVVTAKDNVTVTISGIVIEHGNAIYHTNDIPGVAKSQITNLQRARTEAALASMIVGGQPQGYDASWVEIRVHSDEGLSSGGTKWDNGNDDRDPWTPFGGWKETDLPWLKKLSDGSATRAARWAFNKELYISSNPIFDDAFEYGYKSQPTLTPFFPLNDEYGSLYSDSEKVFPYNVVPLLEEGMPGPRTAASNKDLLYPRGVKTVFSILFQNILGLNQAYYDAFHRRGNGGGVRSFRCGKLLFQDCVFRKNSADLYGGAVFSKHSAVRYELCHAFENVAYAAGGALCHFEDTFRALDCDFVNNRSGEGGGIYTIWEGDDYKSSSQSVLELAIEKVEGKAKGAFKNHEQKILSGATRESIRDMVVLAAGNRLEEGVNQLVLGSYNPGIVKTQMIIAAYSGFKYFNDWLERKGCDGDKTCVAFSRFMMDVTDSIDLVLKYTDISNYFAQLVEITSEPAVLHGDNILGIFGNSKKIAEEAQDAAALEQASDLTKTAVFR
jgi:predicted outer membrane repeat protein